VQPMYPGMVNSPVTELAAAIDNAQTTIEVVDGAALPPAPNLATLGTSEDAETVLYTGINGNTLTGVTRGFQGTPKAWAAGTKVARLFTAYDHEAFRANIIDHEAMIEQNTSAAQQAQQTAQQVQQALGEHLNDIKQYMVFAKTVNQSIPSGGYHYPTFEAQQGQNEADFAEIDQTSGRVKFKKAGIYNVTAKIAFATNAIGVREVDLTNFNVVKVNAMSEEETIITVSGVIVVPSIDTLLELSVRQTSGSSLDVLGGSNYENYETVIFIGKVASL